MISLSISDKYNMNRILIVTSQVTFVPRNYANLFSEFLKLREKDIEFKNSYKIKVVLLKNRSPLLIIIRISDN